MYLDAMASVDSTMDLIYDCFHDDPTMVVWLDKVRLYEVNSLVCYMSDVGDYWKKLLTPDRIHISELRRLEFVSIER